MDEILFKQLVIYFKQIGKYINLDGTLKKCRLIYLPYSRKNLIFTTDEKTIIKDFLISSGLMLDNKITLIPFDLELFILVLKEKYNEFYT